ncbi:preprotein translocase subunit SecA [Candidatus Solincola tengchongensis]|uniref:preprotein translocase subunit SecA n=1 Tax=Candidatus Solincola tengchongensis TaxID=2900693 RepID=UPI00257FEBEE|nr:preprotein translocase subunit SecA [Candidatus Solincola tengchongensis]
MLKALGKVLRMGERKRLEQLEETVRLVNALEPEVQRLSDEELRAKTGEFKSRLERGESLDDLLPEAFAVVREAAVRTLGQRHFDVQIMGGIVLHQGKIAEMKTGEGKTLVATLPVYLNALEGKGVHVVTVNDYLARRDSEWMGAIYRFLGLSVGLIQAQMPKEQRRRAYAADVTYGTNNEFGFDYLRDNLEVSLAGMVQRGHHYAIVDEVDSILIDEARTPLIISGAAEESARLYRQFASIAPRLKPGVDYEVEEKTRTVSVTEEGIRKVEAMLGVDNLYDHLNTPLVHHLHNALKAKELYRRDVDYVVTDGQVVIVDEFTGRLMPGRRWSDGLHQAIEAKEGLRVRQENQTLATITLQNYFRMYEKLAGMTGTAATEAAEFEEIYGLEVVVIPTNLPMIREDKNDVIYKTEEAKFRAVVEDIASCYERGQPVLVGTISIEKSERLSAMLRKRGIPHQVLNAKHHAREAEIVAQAGRLKTVTIATNMAGRGTDIMLGGNPRMLAQKELLGRVEMDEEAWRRTLEEEGIPWEEWERKLAEVTARCEEEKRKVIELGGLYVLGTERHEARRIDNQLRGRSGRQGDPGVSRFYLSLEDDLMRVFASHTVASLMDRLRLPDDLPIENRMVTRAIETAQKNVEANHFEMRKNLLKYDDVMNTQREVIYGERRRILEGEDIHSRVREMIEEVIGSAVAGHVDAEAHPEDWDLEGLFRYLRSVYPVTFEPSQIDLDSVTPEALRDALVEDALEVYERREREFAEQGQDIRELERLVMLRVIDNRWRDHLYDMDHLRDSVGLRSFAGRDPLVEYQNEAFRTFQELIFNIQEEFLRYMFHVRLARVEERPSLRVVEGEGGKRGKRAEPARSQKVGRNAPCPCGSGKKYKHCCGKSA